MALWHNMAALHQIQVCSRRRGTALAILVQGGQMSRRLDAYKGVWNSKWAEIWLGSHET